MVVMVQEYHLQLLKEQVGEVVEPQQQVKMVALRLVVMVEQELQIILQDLLL
tara:strand:- start:129 stop:284 length:156 start_codon:yes stop_codon:yes gene_type:complete